MKQLRSKSDKQKVQVPPKPPNNQFYSLSIARNAAQTIIRIAVATIARNEHFKQSLQKLSQLKTLRDINQITNQQLSAFKKASEPQSPVGPEPPSLSLDSMSPISTKLDTENTYKKNLKTIKSYISASVSQLRKIPMKKSQYQGNPYHKLNFEQRQQEEDGFIQQLRKIEEDKAAKEMTEVKAKKIEKELLAAKLKLKQKERDDKLSFDYNGAQLKVRTEQKSNLISKLVDGVLDSNTVKVKEASNDKNPTCIDDAVSKLKGKNPLNLTKRKDDIQFCAERSLSESIQVGRGVKYIFQGKTMEGKKKSFSNVQLKNAMMQSKRLSKQQFQRVKSLNGSMFFPQEQQQQTKSTPFILHQKSKSVGNLLPSLREQVHRERIIVNSESLRSKLLQKVNELKTEPKQEKKFQLKEKISVGFTDVFNMNYLRSGGLYKSQLDGRTLDSSSKSTLSLPKIQHTTVLSHFLPKGRQKLKDANKIIRQLRKSFEQKLRN